MAFRQRSLETRRQQVGRLYLRRWYFFEKYFSYFREKPGSNRAINFFKSLKELPEEEIALLAEKYYKPKEYCCYDKELGDYTSVKPYTHKELSFSLGRDSEELADSYREIERKLGANIIGNWGPDKKL